MEQTAVEWLANRIIELEERLRLKEINLNDFIEEKDLAVEQANEMFKEQIIKAVKFGDLRGKLTSYLTAEVYYNETYKSK